MAKKFDSHQAKKFLEKREGQKKEKNEEERKEILQKIIQILKEELQGSPVEVFLVGSIVRPFSFSEHSDVDIVLKNFKGDRFDFWTKIEGKISRSIEIILFEKCHFQEFVIKEGIRVL